MAEYIERDAARLAVMRAGCIGNILPQLETIPAADVVAVVRCKDCSYFRAMDGCPMAESGYFKGGKLIPHEEDFCPYGERKENG